MTTKEGYKLVLVTGEQLSHVLAAAQKKQLDDAVPPEDQFDAEQLAAQSARGTGSELGQRQIACSSVFAVAIQDQIDYAEHLIASDRRGKLAIPPGS
jgi:hypothetical protein